MTRRPLTAPRTGRVPGRRRWAARAVALVAALGAATACSDGSTAPPVSAAAAPPTTATVAPTTAPPTTAPPTTVTAPSTTTAAPAGPALRLVAIGDSYSAGNGATTKELDITRTCSRDPQASIGTLAADALRARGIPVDLDLRACSGGTVAQVVQQAADVRGADAISVTFGGNDLGFSRIIGDCLLRGCKSYDQPGDRLPGLAHDLGQDDWQVLQDRVVAGLAALREHLAPGGRVYVFTYPLPFPTAPDPACLQSAAPFSDTSRMLVNAATEKLDRAIADAADAANKAAGAAYVDVVEWRTGLDRPLRAVTDAGVTREIRDNPNGICSPEPFVNGIATTGELSDSFHPTDRGHAFAAEALARAVQIRTRR